jgi:hypothetical protein
MSASSSKRPAAADAPPPKRPAPSLQRELELERERHRRCQDSVAQLRIEVQMMGRLLASTRERLVACGAEAFAPDLVVRAPPPVGGATSAGARPVATRSKSDAKLLRRLQEELAESRGQCKWLTQQLEQQGRKAQLVVESKKELLSMVGEMNECERQPERSPPDPVTHPCETPCVP